MFASKLSRRYAFQTSSMQLARILEFKSWAMPAFFAAGVIANFAAYLYSAATSQITSHSLPDAPWHQLSTYWPHASWQVPGGPWAGWLGLVMGLAHAIQSNQYSAIKR